MTQTERVIAAARSYRGVCAVDFLGPDVIDGGKPITRVAARIQDAEERGYVFETIGWRSKMKVYRLVSEPEGVESGSSERRPATHRGSGPAPAGTDQAGAAAALSADSDGDSGGRGRVVTVPAVAVGAEA